MFLCNKEAVEVLEPPEECDKFVSEFEIANTLPNEVTWPPPPLSSIHPSSGYISLIPRDPVNQHECTQELIVLHVLHFSLLINLF